MKVILRIFLIVSLAISMVEAQANATECAKESAGGCYNKPEALKLKIIAIFTILFASMAGIALPLYSHVLPALAPEKKLFVVVKAFASGVILSTGFMHVLPDSVANLTSNCLSSSIWRSFPFSHFIAMVSSVATLMMESLFMAVHHKRHQARVDPSQGEELPSVDPATLVHAHGHDHFLSFAPASEAKEETMSATLRRYRVIAQVLEMGIVVHSIVIGLSMGASQNPCTIRPLVAALCFHQFFEGMGLGGCLVQAEYKTKMKLIMVFFFSITTPLGVALGIGLSNVYSDNSPTALIVIGLLNACSSGLLIYMALVDLLAADFMGPRLQASLRLQGWGYLAVLLGMAGMSVMAKWA